MKTLSPEHRARLNFDARVEAAKYFAKQKDVLRWGWILFPEKFPLPFCKPLHTHLIKTRMKEFSCTEAPRNHSKTTIECFLIPIFQALEEPHIFKHYLNVQATGDKALDINRSIKFEFEMNETIKAIYGDQMGNDRWTEGQFVTKNGVVFSAIGAGQSIRGLNYRNIRPDYIIVDDLYDEEDIENLESTRKKTRWFWGSLYPARAKSRRCSIHVQGTAINSKDILEELKTKERWNSRTFSAEDGNGNVLWPELNTLESLEADKIDMGLIIYNREMMNIRRDDAESIIKQAYLAQWEFDPVDLYHELAIGKTRILNAVIIGNDPSIGKESEKKSDFTGTSLIYETRWADGSGGTEYWIMGLWNEKISLVKRIEQLEQIAGAQPKGFEVTRVNIEAIAGFNDYAEEVIRKTNLPVNRIDWVKDKITTLVNKSKFFENGKVHLNRGIDKTLKDMLCFQLTVNKPDHDDLRDGVLLAIDSQTVNWSFVDHL